MGIKETSTYVCLARVTLYVTYMYNRTISLRAHGMCKSINY